MEKKILLKNIDTLRISGRAFAVFGVWSILKTVLSFLFPDSPYYALMNVEELSREELVFGLLLLAVLMAIDFTIRLRIARRALQEAEGIETKSLYLYLAGLIGLLSLGSMVGYVIYGGTDQNSWTIASDLLIDASSVFCAFDLIRAGITVRRYRKELSHAG